MVVIIRLFSCAWSSRLCSPLFNHSLLVISCAFLFSPIMSFRFLFCFDLNYDVVSFVLRVLTYHALCELPPHPVVLATVIVSFVITILAIPLQVHVETRRLFRVSRERTLVPSHRTAPSPCLRSAPPSPTPSVRCNLTAVAHRHAWLHACGRARGAQPSSRC